MRKIFATIMAAGLILPLSATPALADAPEEFTDVRVFEASNPCDPTNVEEVTNMFNVKLHEHENNTVLVIDIEVTTDAGFEGTGHETTIFRDDLRTTTSNFVLHNPDTGERFTVHGHFKLDLATGEFIKGSPLPTTKCLGS